MTRKVTVAFACAAIMIFAPLVLAQNDAAVVLYSGDLNLVELGSWGSGVIEIDGDERYLQSDALRIETGGFFTGGRLTLREPLDASAFLGDPSGGYLRLIAKALEPAPETPMIPEGGFFPGEGGFPGGPFPGEMPPGFDPGAMPPEGQFPGGMPPEWQPGMEPGMEGGMMAPPEPPKKIERLRVLLVTDSGALDSGAIELADYPLIVDDWVEIVLPMTAFGGPVDVKDGEILHVALFGDTEETFWVGEVGLGYEAQPLVAEAGEPMVTKVNTETQFQAAEQPAGVNALYIWDFDELDGLQEQGYGRETTWTFPTPGYYLVTLTVSDPDGKKVDRMDRVRVQVTN